MLPVIAIIGRPNVGKSTLFNCLTKTRDALVADFPGVTRDRLYGEGRIGDRPFIVIDTAGIAEEQGELPGLMTEQAWQAVAEADVLLLVVDGREGLNGADAALAQKLRRFNKTLRLVINKIEGLNAEVAAAEFHRLGLGAPYLVSAAHNQGITQLVQAALAQYPEEPVAPTLADTSPLAAEGTRLAIIGRPNVGKSTLVNRLLGEERMVVYDSPGTTRDSVEVTLERRNKRYVLIDTAGIRRRSRVDEEIEKFSVIKSLQSIERAQVVLLVIDAHSGVSEQDLHLIGFVLEAGKGIVIAVNKWDGLGAYEKERIRQELGRRLQFLPFARIHFISALHGTGVGHLFTAIDEAYQSAIKKMSTPELTRILEQAIAQHQPPLVQGRQIKLRYAHAGGYNPPRIVIHGNQTADLPESYRRYLMGVYREALHLFGTPIVIELKSSVNPFAGKKQQLTLRQARKRKRLLQHVKKTRK